MSRLNANIQSATASIRSWLGVNESPDGDVGLKSGMATEMRNWRVTDSGALRVRPGLKKVAGLLAEYVITEGTETVICEEKNVSSYSAQSWPEAAINTSGGIKLTGTAVTLSFENCASCVGRYLQGGNLAAYKFTRCMYGMAEGGTHIDGGTVNISSEAEYIPFERITRYAAGIRVRNGAVELVSPGTDLVIGGYFQTRDGETGTCDALLFTGDSVKSRAVSWAADDLYIWYAIPVSAQGNTSADTKVRGFWSGLVGGAEILAAACNGQLWRLELTDVGWSKTSIGAINTNGHVGLFGFDRKLYALDGEKYRVWDGTTFTEVEGYVPCVVTAAAPTGGGTPYESVNKLTPKRKERFSADGVAGQFQLSETSLASIDRVAIGGVFVSGWTADAAAGTVTFPAAPAAGASNVEIWYSVNAQAASQLRAEVEHKRYCEFFNGSNDNRVFLYGDGTNETLFCGLTEAGKPTAEYFPDLGEMAVGGTDTPVTALVRHYNRLLAFKPDGAYSIYYATVSYEDGISSPGFYVSPVNRSLGCDAYGQAVLVENRPRTLDAKNIFEWKGSSSSGNITNDTRNAQVVSQCVSQTLKGFDFAQTNCFFDKLAHEYYAVCGETALVQNTENGAWYVYTNFPAAAFTLYRDELYIGDYDGNILHVTDEAHSDVGAPIDAYWRSGSMSFGSDYRRKYSPVLWLGLKPETQSGAGLTVGLETDETELVTAQVQAPVDVPRVQKIRLKSNKFNYYRLILASNTVQAAATVNTVDIRVKFAGDIF